MGEIRGSKMTKKVIFRIEDRDHERIKRASTSLGIGMADFIRMAVRKELARLGYIEGEEAKALKDAEGEQ